MNLYGTGEPPDVLREAFRSGDVPVSVFGLGKMGLPLAAVYAETSGAVTGVDVDTSVIETVRDGDCHVTGEPGLSELVADQVEAGRLDATTDGERAAREATVHVIIVPTTLDAENEPDLGIVEAVCAAIGAGLSPGDLVVAESTLPPGSCHDRLRPLLSAESGLGPGEFGLAFCPERTTSGRALRDIRGAYPKVVGGVDEESARAASLLYDELTENEVHVVSDATTAEAVKVFEGVYRDVNIALANELSTLAEELSISVREAIETANALPMCQLHDPGPGVGGHCIPFYPHFLLAQTDDDLAVTRTARRVNDAMPERTVELLEDALVALGDRLEGASVLVLGYAYRPGVAETRSSPAIAVTDHLRDRGATVFGADPIVDPTDFGALGVDVEAIGDRSYDAAILITPHEEFDSLDWEALDEMVVVDGRDSLDLDTEETHHHVLTLGGPRRNRSPRWRDVYSRLADLGASAGKAPVPKE